jgi:hypothetical protein
MAATLNNIRDLLSAKYDFNNNTIRHILIALQNGGFLKKGKGGFAGVNAPIASAEECIALMLGSVGSGRPFEALENATLFSGLPYRPAPLPPIDREMKLGFVEVKDASGKVVGSVPEWTETWRFVAMDADKWTRRTRLSLGTFLVYCINEIRAGRGGAFTTQNIELTRQGPYRSAVVRKLIQEANAENSYSSKVREYYFSDPEESWPPLIIDFGVATIAKYALEAKCEIRKLCAERAKLPTRVISIEGSILVDFADLLGPLEGELPRVGLPRRVRIAAPEGGGDARTL